MRQRISAAEREAAMDVNKLMVSRIFDSTERLDAPLFQRPNVWTREKNWDPVWEAIKTLAQKKYRPRRSGARAPATHGDRDALIVSIAGAEVKYTRARCIMQPFCVQ
jgi:hypothetical protein